MVDYQGKRIQHCHEIEKTNALITNFYATGCSNLKKLNIEPRPTFAGAVTLVCLHC